MTSPLFALAVGFRPLYFPSTFAFATPSRRRSSMISLSNWATLPARFTSSLPVAVWVSMFIARMRAVYVHQSDNGSFEAIHHRLIGIASRENIGSPRRIICYRRLMPRHHFVHDPGAFASTPQSAHRQAKRRWRMTYGLTGAMWAAQAEADVRTTIDTAKLKGANPFAVIVRALA
jgi:hypothetical protein